MENFNRNKFCYYNDWIYERWFRITSTGITT
jgi:hypothetical protein